jgi:predicted nucleotidyltransferase
VTLLRQVALALDQQRVEFAIVGGTALPLHGVNRSTLDVDILTTDGRVLTAPIWSILEPVATVDIRRGDPDDPLRGVVRIRDESNQIVDVVVGRWIWQREAVERAENLVVDGTPIPVIRAADLALLKLDAGGAQDLSDIEQLLALRGEELAAEVDSRVHDLPAAARERWAALRRHPEER